MIKKISSSGLKATLFACLSIMSVATWSTAQAYPDRPVKIVVPYNAGGGTDILARAVANGVSEILKQPVIVENKAGASGMIGSDYVAKSSPDGYTMVMTAADTHSVNPHVYPNIRYDAKKDFRPIARVGILPYALVINPNVAAKDVHEFIALAKKDPGKMTYASWGLGSTSQVAMEMFNQTTGINLLHVPFTGAAPAVNGVISGQTDAMFVPLSLAVPYAQGGRLKILGLGSSSRFEDAPQVPTLEEQGVKVYSSPWIGILAPAGMPDSAVEIFFKAVQEATRQEKVRQALIKGGLEIAVLNPKEFAKVLEEEYELWGNTVRQAGIKAQ